ncbi:hypothetical protein [uncultured Flavobacterium sp.]|uniref:hypothetical protein n=1 Tax=uncultured Flavobacterium sp. TaxID=165435 RepID=UPI0030C81C16
MKKYILFFVSLFSSISWTQEKIIIKKVDSTYTKSDIFIGKDNLKNDYFTFKNVIKKSNTTQEYEYQNLSFGKIEKICITNPLQIVVFYEDFNALILLDNQLNETQQINGNNFETPIKIEAFGLASQNQVWLYDGFLQKISLYNFKSNINKIISTPLTTMIKDYNSDFNYFYWISEELDFYSISIFGKINNMGKIPEYDTIQIIDNTKIIYSKHKELYYFNTNKALAQKIDLNQKSFDKFFFNNGILSIFTNNQIINYKIDLP